MTLIVPWSSIHSWSINETSWRNPASCAIRFAGIDNIAAELLRKRAWIVPALQAKGYTVLHADAPVEAASGIISFFHPEKDLPALHKKLLESGVVTSLRTDRKRWKYIRFSPHFYNTDPELQRLIELL